MGKNENKNKGKAPPGEECDCVSTSPRSLFSAFYLLALLGKILGVFPLQNVTRIGKRCSGGDFQYCSMAYVYSWLFLPLNVLFLFSGHFYCWSCGSGSGGGGGDGSGNLQIIPQYGKDHIDESMIPAALNCTLKNHSSCEDPGEPDWEPDDGGTLDEALKATDSLITSVNLILQMVIVIGNNLVAVLSGRKVSKIFHEVCEIESTFGVSKKPWRGVRNYAIKIYLWLPLYAFLLFAVAYFQEMVSSLEVDRFQMVRLAVKTVLVVASTIPELIFAFLCKIAGEFLQQNKASLCAELDRACLASRQDVFSVQDDKVIDACASVRRHQSNHMRIAQFVEKLNRAYSKILVNTLACSACIVCFSIYVSANAFFKNQVIVVNIGITLAFLFAVRMAIVTEAGNFVECMADKCMRELVQASYDCEPGQSDAFRKQLSSFYVQVMNHPIKLTASEYFVVNRVFLISGFGTVFNYLIILLQLRINSYLNEDTSESTTSTGMPNGVTDRTTLF